MSPPSAPPSPELALPIWRLADRLLSEAERAVALLERCKPLNGADEQRRLAECLRRAQPESPRWAYAPAADLSTTRGQLTELIERLPADPISALYAGRAAELELEARIVESVGQPRLKQLASQRFGAGEDAHDVEQLAQAWAQLAPVSHALRIQSDDAAHPESLVVSVSRMVGALRLPFQVRVCSTLTAAAATGDGVILVAAGRALGASDVRRIALHEVLGHALPRVRAREQALGLFTVGSQFGNDDQEGYALLLEDEHGVLDQGRQRELGLRHQAALSVQQGADWVQTARQLLAYGADVEQATAITCRAHRGGGLGRELVYLPAWYRVREALAADADLRPVLASGRLSLSAARIVRAAGWVNSAAGSRQLSTS